MRYSSNFLSKKYPFGHVGGTDPNLMFVLQEAALVFALKSSEHSRQAQHPSMLTFREIMTNGRFESDTRIALKKPDFFFGDAITEHDRVLYDRDYKWLRQIGDMRFFLSNMERMYPFAYLQHTSIRRTMEWDLSKSISVMSLGKVGVNEAYPAGHGRDIFGLHPGLISAEYPTGETPQLAATFINQFLKVRGDFPTDFRPLGWVHSTDKSWWGRMLALFLQNSGTC